MMHPPNRSLWTDHYKDAAQLLAKFSSIGQGYAHAYHSLLAKLKDFASTFEYFLKTTKDFFDAEKSRFRKSPLKGVDALKFIPINLHNEYLLVDSACYEFTSVG